MRKQPTPYTASDFQRMLTEEFPELNEEVGQQDNLLHLEMHVFARFTQDAVHRADWDTLKRCVHLAQELWNQADSRLKNALNVSFLEHLNFDGPNGESALSRLTRDLQQGWSELRAYNERLAQHSVSPQSPRRPV